MSTETKNSFNSRATLNSGSSSYTIYRLPALSARGFDLGRLPFSLKILLENLLRREDGVNVTAADIEFLANWDAEGRAQPRNRLHARPRPHAGLHRRPRHRRSGRHARRHQDPRRRSRARQSPASRRTRHRSLRASGRVRHARRPTKPTRCSSSSATASATHSSSGASPRFATSPPCRPAWASATRSISNTSPVSSSPPKSTASCMPIPTRSSAPTRTPP